LIFYLLRFGLRRNEKKGKAPLLLLSLPVYLITAITRISLNSILTSSHLRKILPENSPGSVSSLYQVKDKKEKLSRGINVIILAGFSLSC